MENKISCNVGPLGILVIVFITLKLCGVIAWSWWWVLSPIWIPIAIVLAACAIWLSFLFICSKIGRRKFRRRNIR